jgi:GNAT superfamily N-acetyltransferase
MESPLPLFKQDAISGYLIKPLTLDDESEIQAFLEECVEYKRMESGELPQPDDARLFLTDLPPGKTLEDKFCLAVEKDTRIVALIDIMKNYPVYGFWWIGLLLIHPQEQGKGLGRKISNIILSQLSREDVQEIQLGVLEENEKGYEFWQKMGFHEILRKSDRIFGQKTHTVIIMANNRNG